MRSKIRSLPCSCGLIILAALLWPAPGPAAAADGNQVIPSAVNATASIAVTAGGKSKNKNNKSSKGNQKATQRPPQRKSGDARRQQDAQRKASNARRQQESQRKAADSRRQQDARRKAEETQRQRDVQRRSNQDRNRETARSADEQRQRREAQQADQQAARRKALRRQYEQNRRDASNRSKPRDSDRTTKRGAADNGASRDLTNGDRTSAGRDTARNRRGTSTRPDSDGSTDRSTINSKPRGNGNPNNQRDTTGNTRREPVVIYRPPARDRGSNRITGSRNSIKAPAGSNEVGTSRRNGLTGTDDASTSRGRSPRLSLDSDSTSRQRTNLNSFGNNGGTGKVTNTNSQSPSEAPGSFGTSGKRGFSGSATARQVDRIPTVDAASWAEFSGGQKHIDTGIGGPPASDVGSFGGPPRDYGKGKGHRKGRGQGKRHRYDHDACQYGSRYHCDDWDDWYWWGAGYDDYYWRCGERWSGWSFSFGFSGGYRSHSWFSFSFGFGGYHRPFYRPWDCYAVDYDRCRVSYYRPWRHWDRYYHTPYYRFAHRRPWYYQTDYYYEPPVRWYASYRSLEPEFQVVQTSFEPALPSVDHAWSLLRNGRLESARDTFADLVYALPYEGEARIGYALTSGLLGYDAAATSAMRRALRDDPDALRYLPDDVLIRDQIRALLTRYGDRVRLDFSDYDSLFMVASLRFVLGEYAPGYFAIDAGIRGGDGDDSAYNLKSMLENAMYDQF